MKHDPISVWAEDEYHFPMTFGFRPDMTPYLHDDEETRPCVIVVPGGGYAMVSPTEGELVAQRFYEAGCQSFVVSYTTNLLLKTPLNEQPMTDLARAIRLIRGKAHEFRVDPNQIALCGFSAGGHLCGSVCVFGDEIVDPDPTLNTIDPRPNAAILSYPVITTGEFAHQRSFQALLGEDIYRREDEEAKFLLDRYSLEKQVNEKTPPCFLWQTITDETVPVENSILMAQALRRNGVLFAHHLFSEGRHGLSLANEDWANHRYGDTHCEAQLHRMVEAVRSGKFPLPESQKEIFLKTFAEDIPSSDQPVLEVQPWPDLAISWLQKIFGK